MYECAACGHTEELDPVVPDPFDDNADEDPFESLTDGDDSDQEDEGDSPYDDGGFDPSIG